MEEEKLVYTFKRNPEEQIRFTLREFKERHYVDVRLWYQPRGGGDYHPTRKGITFAVDHLGELSKGLEKAGKVSQELALQRSPRPIK